MPAFSTEFSKRLDEKNVNQDGIRAIKLFVFCDVYRDDWRANVSLDAGSPRRRV